MRVVMIVLEWSTPEPWEATELAKKRRQKKEIEEEDKDEGEDKDEDKDDDEISKTPDPLQDIVSINVATDTLPSPETSATPWLPKPEAECNGAIPSVS
ncbi:hypothetical protein CKAH01_13749 [Colletotrichum kahawae]|uniref:Uncharacterized protein n=1 Tax=Colletotrichum kahawae TaxID=34407 RepID=A0AAE0DB12_COLKA|nr:hypothetical protein CKAH01_13749 [Colletotrichum kahawae]